MSAVLGWAERVILVFFLLAALFQLALLISAVRSVRRHRSASAAELAALNAAADAPAVSLLVPAYNEEATVAESVRALLTLHYPDYEVIVVNDGSSDRTLDRLRRAYDLVPLPVPPPSDLVHEAVTGIYRSRTHPRLVVVDKVNGGKADALNAALGLAGGDLVCAVDADTLIEPDGLSRLVRPFLQDPQVVATGGTIRVVNGATVRAGRVDRLEAPTGFLAGVQAVEYVRAFLFGRLGFNALGGNLIVSGAFGVFRRDAVLAVGGYMRHTVAEDMELVIRLRRRAYEEGTAGRILFLADPVAWTEAPSSLRVLGRQRDRWHRGLAEAMTRHASVILNPRYRSMGMVVAPYFAFLELLAPLVEAVGLAVVMIGLVGGAGWTAFAGWFLLVAYGLGLFLTLAALALDELAFRRYRRTRDRLRLVGFALLESFGYRQLTVAWRLRGMWGFVRGRRDWGTMTRRGFAPGGSERASQETPSIRAR